ncbi:MAG: Unknown protein [uncultured Sulfurovum sp.]|uniref:Uncharacterized protein n=1 Tax=uncultured Sulfurovum sp. TaxID=269237 RepID=A0A6S6SUW6_9BACT|nr:MAG: Unknown protein [uncultured Sulfurovum sp.]
MTLKEKTINKIITVEGGYVNHKDDSGGETMHGITKETAYSHGYRGDMRYLSRATAFEIYAATFWDAQNLSKVEELSYEVTKELADTGVNMGTKTAAIFLQRCLNVLNNKAKHYRDINVDGKIGRETIRSLRLYLKGRGKEGEEVLVVALNGLQTARYITLAERNMKNESFVYGWLSHRVTKPLKSFFASIGTFKSIEHA